MVLTQMVGKKRPFARGFVLTVFTFGIYGIYWLYKAHDELFKQFELQREGRDEGVVWLILGLILFPLQFVYAWIFVGNVGYLRQRLDLRKGIAPGVFVALEIAAYAVFMIAYVALVLAAAGLDENATEEEVIATIGALAGGFFLALLAFIGIRAAAYYRLQRDVNEVWDAYEQRMRSIHAAPAAASAPDAPAASYTYWGDLRPPAPSLSAPHVRARAEGLARDHPGIVLPAELPDLLSRGEAGDAAALSAAAALMDGVDRLLREREHLRGEQETAERRSQRLAARLADGELDAAAYASARDELDRERARVEARLAEVESRLFTTRPASEG